VRYHLEYCVQMWNTQKKGRHRPIGEHPEEGHKNAPRDGMALLQGQAESWGCSAWRKEGPGETFQALTGGRKKERGDPLAGCVVTGQRKWFQIKGREI